MSGGNTPSKVPPSLSERSRFIGEFLEVVTRVLWFKGREFEKIRLTGPNIFPAYISPEKLPVISQLMPLSLPVSRVRLMVLIQMTRLLLGKPMHVREVPGENQTFRHTGKAGVLETPHKASTDWEAVAALVQELKAPVHRNSPHEILIKAVVAPGAGKLQRNWLLPNPNPGLTPHLVRSIPSAIITLGVYEFVLRMANSHTVERPRIVYILAGNITHSSSIPELFGLGQLGSCNIMPIMYRASETVLHIQRGYPVDIWSVEFVVYLFVGKTLFSARKVDGSSSDGAHFAKLIAVLALEYWDALFTGKTYKLENNLKFLQFIRRALIWDPDTRPTAEIDKRTIANYEAKPKANDVIFESNRLRCLCHNHYEANLPLIIFKAVQ
ncbi:protein kinase domain-containing protein [Colletotrichum cuscutae]|uniref:Protein kinase domain-containing protein n=1 Tax=Colletotrichum cuscutae TaxID=1209917 RepID=A0AAI9Y362_9PEZI|nr:protein kinase domain-containing protein [Colletotrichum cuscutae]